MGFEDSSRSSFVKVVQTLFHFNHLALVLGRFCAKERSTELTILRLRLAAPGVHCSPQRVIMPKPIVLLKALSRIRRKWSSHSTILTVGTLKLDHAHTTFL